MKRQIHWVGLLELGIVSLLRAELFVSGYNGNRLLYVSSQLNDRVLCFDATNGEFVDAFVTNTPAAD